MIGIAAGQATPPPPPPTVSPSHGTVSGAPCLPQDCTGKRWFVLHNHRGGMGSALNMMVETFITAFYLGTIFVVDQSVTDYPDPHRCPSKTYGCYFAPLSNCSIPRSIAVPYLTLAKRSHSDLTVNGSRHQRLLFGRTDAGEYSRSLPEEPLGAHKALRWRTARRVRAVRKVGCSPPPGVR